MTLKFSFSCKIIKGRKAASERTETNGSLALLNLPVALFCEHLFFELLETSYSRAHIGEIFPFLEMRRNCEKLLQSADKL